MLDNLVLTVEECAKELKVAPSDVMMLIKNNELCAKKIGTNLRISVYDLLKYLDQPSTINNIHTSFDSSSIIYPFNKIAKEWKDEHWKTIEYNTTKSYNPAYNRAVLHFNNVDIKYIQPKDINEFIKQYAQTGVYRKTVRTQLLIMNLIFNYCVLKGYLKYNPAECIEIPRHLPHKIRTLPSKENIDKIKKGLNSTFGLFAYLLLFTGCRKGEALALKYSDIDRNNKFISISKSVYYVGNKPFLKYPKTDSGIRKIILLNNLEKALPFGNPQDYIFSNDKNNILTSSQFQKYWKAYCKDVGIYKIKPYLEKSGRIHNRVFPLITPHQLRHAYATLLFDAGIDEKDAQQLLGHASIVMTRDVYTHISSERKEKTARILNEYLSHKLLSD